jgi:hypothetical protein
MTPGPIAARPHLPAMPRHPRPAALPYSPACLRRERVLPPSTAPQRAILAPLSGYRPRAHPSFSLSPSPPPISLSALPARPPIWRRCRRLTPLRVHARARAPLLLHCLRIRLSGFTLRPFHPRSLSPFEVALTFLLPHRHCRVVPPSPPATGAPSLPTNAAA